MKKLFVSFGLFAGICGVAPGQVAEERPKHSFSVSVGVLPFTYDREAFDGGSCSFYPGPNLIEMWKPGGVSYAGKLKTTGAISLSYNYRLKKWLELGITGTYTGFYQEWHNASNDRRHYFYFMPGANFYWLRRPTIEMYSGFNVGVGFLASSEGWELQNKSFAGGHITLAGVRVGKGRFYFMSEVGVGMKGFANAGAGFRF